MDASNSLPSDSQLARKRKADQVDATPCKKPKTVEVTTFERVRQRVRAQKVKSDDRVMISHENRGQIHTHAELHPAAFMGVMASTIVFSDHNPGTRNSYGCNIFKGAPGESCSNVRQRMDGCSYLQWYKMKPIVATIFEDLLRLNKFPVGHPASVLIDTSDGAGVEDSYKNAKSSLELGMFRITSQKTLVVTENKNSGGVKEEICMSNNKLTTGMKNADYSRLDADGIIPPGSYATSEIIVVNRSGPIKSTSVGSSAKRYDNAFAPKITVSGQVDASMLTTIKDGLRSVKVRLCKTHITEVGDKFSSRIAQKGVCGEIIREEDLPYTICGLTPDIIINSHAFPSRMTWGQIIEMILAVIAAANGNLADGTPFDYAYREALYRSKEDRVYESTGEILEELKHALEILGLPRNLEYQFYSGVTGEPLKENLFFGRSHYLKLSHMVSNKVRARARGKESYLTHQPTETRTEDGGLKLGNMEFDCVMAHGASDVFNDKAKRDSEPHFQCVCTKCGLPSWAPREATRQFCPGCRSFDSSVEIYTGYSLKRHTYAVLTMCMVQRLEVRSLPDDKE